MADELLDIVDENDTVIGQLPFAEVHAKGLKHRFTRVLLQSSDGVFVLHRRSAMAKHFAGQWDSAGGHVQSGESYHQGAQRELAEEMGINAELTLLGAIAIKTENPQEDMLGQAFLCRHNGPYAGDAEVEIFTFWRAEQIEEQMTQQPEVFTPQLQAAWQCYQKTKQI